MLNLTFQEIKLLAEGGMTALAAVGIPGYIYFRKKRVNFDTLFSTAKVGIEEAEKAVAVVEEVAPNNTVVDVAEIILKWVKEGVDKSEQLYHDSQLSTKEERFNAAKETVYTALKEYNITPTENQEKLINDTIYAGVNRIGHKDKTEAEKAAAMEKIQVEKAQLASENAQLKQAISQFRANTAGTVQSDLQTS